MNHLERIKQSSLFQGFSDSDLEHILKCLGAKNLRYRQREFIFHEGDSIERIGIVLSGKAVVIKDDEEGNRVIISEISPGSMFAEGFACARESKIDVSVMAAEESEILFIDYTKIAVTCPHTCDFHVKLIKNMLEILAKRIVMLNQKIEVISKRTIREKLLAYFEMQKRRAKSSKFTIPYNREQLAHFLFADRSAVSRELSKMREEGLIKFKKNRFELIEK